ncbi:MAG: hypothetical protein HQ553_13345 [Chloroflexi bacterium]|nr:hypothetical protein [Chloroflexota bacterium]
MRKRNKIYIVFLLISIISLFMTNGCSSDNEEPLSEEEYITETYYLLSDSNYATSEFWGAMGYATQQAGEGGISASYNTIETAADAFNTELQRLKKEWDKINPPTNQFQNHKCRSEVFDIQIKYAKKMRKAAASEDLDLMEASPSTEDVLEKMDECT